MKHLTKLTNHQEQEHTAELHSAQKPGQEFAGVEELLRHDAQQTNVPPGIADRLRQSAGQPGSPRSPWWRRWLD